MIKIWITHIIATMGFVVLGVLSIASAYSPPPPPPPAPPQPRNVLVSEDVIEVDWSHNSAIGIRTEIMHLVQENLSRYRFYHIAYNIHPDPANSRWRNEVRICAFRNPSHVRIRLVFNYFLIDYFFSDSQLVSGGVNWRESPFFSGRGIQVFTRDVNNVLNRISLGMRGRTFGSWDLYEWDRLWIEALGFQR